MIYFEWIAKILILNMEINRVDCQLSNDNSIREETNKLKEDSKENLR